MWLASKQAGVLFFAILLGIIAFVAQATTPFAIGRALDSGLENGLTKDVLMWAGVLLAAGVVQVSAAALGHRFDVLSWVRAALTTSRLISDTVSTRGDAIREELPTGEVVSSVTSDAHRLGDLYFQTARFMGSLATYVVVGVFMLNTSVKLGLIIALGLPTVAVILGFLIKPLQKRQEHQREVTGRLTSLGSDTVTGLRILRGIGGEAVFTQRYKEQSQKVRDAGVSVANMQANMDGLQVLLPGIFVAVVMWVGAQAAVAGEITAGQLVTFYGYAAFLTWPMYNLIQMVQIATRAKVGVIRVLKVLSVKNHTPDTGSITPVASGGSLIDEVSGTTLENGRYVALVAADPDVSALIATRMARFNDAAESDTRVTYNGILLKDYVKDDLRRSIVLAESTPHIFAGTLRAGLDTRGGTDDSTILNALHVADAHDVLESLPHGLDSELPEKGRSLSGGQRQRVALARALLTEAEHLILIEPTSAVDAHTEARIGAQLRQYRAGKSTLVVTASPLVLEHMDAIEVLDNDGKVIGTGTHSELMSDMSTVGRTYRAIVAREVGDEDTDARELHTLGTEQEVSH